ncbi:MAG TPA: hypothetical protein VGI39_26095 [Polyangiaceae bacterium]
MTPGRLALHEIALAGVQVKAGTVFGSYDGQGHYVSPPSGASEFDFEQDLFGAVRLLERGQVALLVPFVETHRTASGIQETGGGLGDVNANVRYDFLRATESKIVPGIAALAGVTFPTGTAPDAPGLGPLATGATGVGAYQLNVGLALEQAWGPWLASLTGILAQRFARDVSYPGAAGSPGATIHERLALQGTVLAALAYVLPNERALALSVAYAGEGDATINGVESAGTAHRLITVGLSGVIPFSDLWRLQAGLTLTPPVDTFGANQPASAGLLATLVRAWN